MLAASAGELWPQLRAFGPRMEPGWTRGSPLEPQLGLTDGPVPGTYSARSYTCNFAARTLTPDCFFLRRGYRDRKIEDSSPIVVACARMRFFFFLPRGVGRPPGAGGPRPASRDARGRW